MERDKKLNRYLEEEFVYMKAMEKAKTYKSSDGIDTINLKDIDPEKVDYIITAHYDTPPRLPKFFVKHMLLYSLIASSAFNVFKKPTI